MSRRTEKIQGRESCEVQRLYLNRVFCSYYCIKSVRVQKLGKNLAP